jgi:hypothetical protein
MGSLESGVVDVPQTQVTVASHWAFSFRGVFRFLVLEGFPIQTFILVVPGSGSV